MHQILKIQDRIFMYIDSEENIFQIWTSGDYLVRREHQLIVDFLKNTEITSSSKSHASDAKWQKNVSCIKNELKRSKHETARSSNTHNALQV